MNLNERIREVRKKAKLNQTEFGEKLGVSRSVIANIELDLNKTGVPDNIIKLICYSFKINENWLRTGEGEMKTKTNENVLEQLKNTYNLSNLEFAILEGYLKLDKAQRIAFENFLDNVMNLKLKHELPNGIYDPEDEEIEKVSEEIFEEDENNNYVNTKKESSKIG